MLMGTPTRSLPLTALVAACVTVLAAAPSGRVQAGPDAPLDALLDRYVRDGFVYYAALKLDRPILDRYLLSRTDRPAGFDRWSREQQIAFWLNSYNAIVLRTVIDHYPIRGTSNAYPAVSVRQIPGAFDVTEHAVAGRQLTLDALEATVLASFDDPRLFLALGRGADGGGRLRSEAFTAALLETQLAAVVQEFATTPRGVILDRLGAVLRVSPIFGWREAEFVGAYADGSGPGSGRTPLERAIMAVIAPALFPSERAFLDDNRFTLAYQDFDWRLNDLTGGRP